MDITTEEFNKECLKEIHRTHFKNALELAMGAVNQDYELTVIKLFLDQVFITAIADKA